MYIFIAIAVMAAVTYIIRALPIAVFSREITSKRLKSFLYYIPYTVLGAMTFPAILYSTGSTIGAAAGLIVALILAFFTRGLLITALGAALAAVLCGIFA